jgi:signal transduction histidine kinase
MQNFEDFNHLITPIVIVDETLKPLYFNHICSTFFKLSPRKLSKLNSLLDLPFAESHEITLLLQNVIKSQTPLVSKELILKNDFFVGQGQSVVLKIIPYNKSYLINILDTSIERQLHEKYRAQVIQLKENHEQIVLADKLTALGELIAGIGHEISNPMTIVGDLLIRLNESMLRKDFIQLREDLKKIDIEFKRVNKIISNMQSIVKNQEEEISVVSMKQIVESAAQFLQELQLLNTIDLKLHIDNDLWVMGNEIKLQQLVINLLKNAIDATKDQSNPQITIELYHDKLEQMVSLRVLDNGPGVKEEDQDKIFDMFYTTKELGEGTGLGLAICQKIAQSIQGVLVLEKTDKGASFLLQLPIIEFSSFYNSNKYFAGLQDNEDPIIIVHALDLNAINQFLTMTIDRGFTIVVTQESNRLYELNEFYDAKVVMTLDKNLQNEKVTYFELDQNLVKKLNAMLKV